MDLLGDADGIKETLGLEEGSILRDGELLGFMDTDGLSEIDGIELGAPGSIIGNDSNLKLWQSLSLKN